MFDLNVVCDNCNGLKFYETSVKMSEDFYCDRMEIIEDLDDIDSDEHGNFGFNVNGMKEIFNKSERVDDCGNGRITYICN